MTIIEHCRYTDGLIAALRRIENDLPHARRDQSKHLSGLEVACSLIQDLIWEANHIPATPQDAKTPELPQDNTQGRG